jgi:hypothetical protein
MELQDHHTATTSPASALPATNPPWRTLTHRTTSPSSAPKREHDTIGAAAAQSKDFGFSPGSLKWGWGEGTSMVPQGRREAPEERHRHRGQTSRPRVSTGTKRTPPSPNFLHS